MFPTPACQLEVLFLEAVEPPGGAAGLEEVCHWGQVFEGFTLLGPLSILYFLAHHDMN